VFWTTPSPNANKADGCVFRRVKGKVFSTLHSLTYKTDRIVPLDVFQQVLLKFNAMWVKL